MKTSKILLILIIGIISLNMIFAGTVSKTFLIKGDLSITTNLSQACQSGTASGVPVIDNSQVYTYVNPANQTLSSSKSGVIELFFAAGADRKCKLEIYTPNNLTTPIYYEDGLNATGIKSKLNNGIVIGPINIASTSDAVNFVVKIKSNAPTYSTTLLTTSVLVPNPNALNSHIDADSAAWSALAEEAESLVGGQGTGTTSVIAPAMTAGTCTLSNDREFKNVDGILKFCFGDQGEWVDVRELYSTDIDEGVLDLPVEEPSQSTTVNPVLMRYWDAATSSWKVKWKRIDTHAIGPGGVIPMEDLNISNRSDAQDGSLLSWDETANQMIWKPESELYGDLVTTSATSPPILVSNKYASYNLKLDGENYQTYLLPVYRLPTLYSASNIMKLSGGQQGYYAKDYPAVLTYNIYSENNTGTFGVNWYYKPTGGAEQLISGCSRTILGSTFSQIGVNNYRKEDTCNWTPSAVGRGTVYAKITKGTDIVTTPEKSVYIFNKITNVSISGGACTNNWGCHWGWRDHGFSYGPINTHDDATISEITINVTGGSGNFEYWTSTTSPNTSAIVSTSNRRTFWLPGLGKVSPWNGYQSVNVVVTIRDLATGQYYTLNPARNYTCSNYTVDDFLC